MNSDYPYLGQGRIIMKTRKVSKEEKNYNKAGELLVDWVENCDKMELTPPMACTLILSTAINLCFHTLGGEKTIEAIDIMVREEFQKIEDNISKGN